MPGPIHQGLLFLLKFNPRIVFDLARHFDTHIGEGHRNFEAASNELPDPANKGNILHADWVVAALSGDKQGDQPVAGMAVEVQTSNDWLKGYSWLSYAAGIRRLFKCRGWTLVFAPDADVRRFAQKMFETEPRASPWFVEPEMLPPIVDIEQALQDVDKAVLSVVFQARSIHGVTCARVALEALLQVAHPHRPVYVDLVHATLTEEQVQQIPKRLFDIDEDAPLGPMELTGAYYTRGLKAGREEGREAGREEGREEGVEQGQLLEARRVIERVLHRRGLALDQAQRQHIQSCDDLERLESWLDKALIATAATQLFE
jgi:hypothetical protein